ncbi:polysaccharide deacetylase family protein [Amycolatopsis alkalitolerans]|uniref:polysaccharide deacetylase family protein n=1 Tax=Amycolatopsis alkalitolerans TaxID=2547244 RepID=UPI001F235EAF|nr:polysaccharide deacetylase family protein [Amycolatopsis alkalitolerans]
MPRILKLLERFQAPSTFFVPAVSALLHDGEVKSYVDAGHEVALHGWIHERNTQLPPEAERDLAFRGADTLERLAGARPVGIRTPSWDFSAATLRIIRELGLRYDSSLMADDDCYEILAELLEHIASHEGVWFATHAQIAAEISCGSALGSVSGRGPATP